MIVTALTIACMFLCAWVSRSATPEHDWRLVRRVTLTVVLVVIAGTVVCLATRGFSNSAVALLGGSLVLAGLGLVLLARLELRRAAGRSGRVWVATVEPRIPNARLARTSLVWLALCSLFMIAPLRYVGALATNPVDVRVSELITFNHFGPLVERRLVAVEQCLANRELGEVNDVVPCGAPHRAQVVAEVSSQQGCPGVNTFDLMGIDLTMKSSVIDGRQFCYVVQRDSVHSWSGRVASLVAIPNTV